MDKIVITVRQHNFSKMLSRLALSGLRKFEVEFGSSSTIDISFETSELFDIIKDTKCFDYDTIQKLMSVTFKGMDKWRENRISDEEQEMLDNSPEEERDESED